MIGFHTIRGGRYKCDFCDHTSYKTIGGIQNHLKDQHLHSLRLAEKDAEIERLKNLPPKVIEKERIVYRDAPKPNEKKKSIGMVQPVFIAVHAKKVISNPGIPVGQTIESTPCACGNRTLMLITEFK